MTILFVGLAVLIVGSVWAFYKPEQKDKVVNKAKETSNNVKVPSVFTKWNISRLTGRKRPKELAQQFKAWAATDFVANKVQVDGQSVKAMATWSSALPDKEFEAFMQQIAGFCTEHGFELAWLFNSKLDNDWVLKQELEELVLLYSVAHWKAVQAKEDINVFLAVQDWEAGKKPELTPKMFFKLVNQGLIATPSSSLFIAPEKERTAYMVAEIRQFGTKDQQKLKAIMKETLAEPEEAVASESKSTATPPASEPIPAAASG